VWNSFQPHRWPGHGLLPCLTSHPLAGLWVSIPYSSGKPVQSPKSWIICAGKPPSHTDPELRTQYQLPPYESPWACRKVEPQECCVQPLNQPLVWQQIKKAACAVDASSVFSFGPLQIMRQKHDWGRTLLPPISLTPIQPAPYPIQHLDAAPQTRDVCVDGLQRG